MLRLASRLRCSQDKLKFALNITTSDIRKSIRDNSELSTETLDLKMNPISRYVPTDPSAFLVEDHRLNDGEKITQTVSSISPWVIFALFACAPFVVMKYNLERRMCTLAPLIHSRPSIPIFGFQGGG